MSHTASLASLQETDNLVRRRLGFGLWRDRNPISTRVELGCLGLAGVLWLGTLLLPIAENSRVDHYSFLLTALGAFLGSSESGDSDVECYSAADSQQQPMEMPGFNTETFHAQYRVLEAFSFFNIILSKFLVMHVTK